MDYEKRYKDALERARKLQENSNGMILKKWLWNIFPELKESEDEKIRKEIISALKYANHKGVYDKHIAWLEKQVEKPIGISSGHATGKLKEIIKDIESENVESKFKVGDWIVRDGKTLQISHIDKVIDGTFHYWFTVGTWLSSAKMEDAHLWTINDARDGDVLYSPCLSLLWIFKSKDTVYCGCNLNYNDGAFCGEGYFERPTDAIPATKIQRDLFFKKMKEAGYEWDAKKKELKKIEQIPTEKEMIEALRTEYEKGRADAIAEM